MRAYRVSFYVFAHADSEASALQRALREFVSEKRESGVAVSATALTHAVEKFKDNYFVEQFLKRHQK